MTEEVHDSSVLITEEVVYYRRAYPSWPLGPDLGIDRLKARREADLALCESHTAHRHDRRAAAAAAYHYNLRHWSPCHAPRHESPTHTTGTRPSRPPSHLTQRCCAATTHTNRKPRHAPLLRCGLVVRLWLSKHAFSFHAFMQAHDNRWPAVFPPTRATPSPFAIALSR